MGNMNEAVDLSKSPIGQSVRRREDRRFITGAGNYTDDVVLHGQTFGVFLRSPHAHARIRSIDLTAAKKAPGVIDIITGADLAEAKVGGLPCGWLIHSKDGTPMKEPAHPVLAQGKVRHVGDQVALVVAETLLQAKDAAELVVVDYEELPAVIDISAADSIGTSVHDDVADNVCYDWGHGDKAAVDAAFAKAAHVTKLSFVNNRLIPNAIEPRAANASYNRSDESYTLYVANQNPHVERLLMCAFVLGLPESKVRVIAPDVGGGFGSKIFLYPEDVGAGLGQQARRPADQVDGRAQRIVPHRRARPRPRHDRRDGDGQGRQLSRAARQDDRQHGRVPVDLRVGGADDPVRDAARRPVQDAGDLRRGQGGVHQHRAGRRLPRRRPAGSDLRRRAHRRAGGARHEDEPGRDPAQELHHHLPVRDAGRPDLRRRRLRGAPRQGDADRRRRRLPGAQGRLGREGQEARPRLRLLHRGVRHRAVEHRRRARRARRGLFEAGEVRVHPTGTVTVFTGSHSHGQGHETTFAQVVAARLGIPVGNVEIVHGDTGRVPFGMGTYGSRSLAVGGTAIVKAVDKVIAKGKKIAAHLLEAADTDIEFENGEFKVAGTDKKVAWGNVTLTAYVPHNFPLDKLEPGLNENAFYDPTNFTYPAGSYICEVEVDPDTGKVKIEQFVAVDDFGNIVNPMIVEGQVHGGIAQGLGQAMMEACCYDVHSGQLVTGSYMDYAMPRAIDIPSFKVATTNTPCSHNPLGVKGCGEAGAIGSPPAYMNALTDALGVVDLAMPATPERVWRAANGMPAA